MKRRSFLKAAFAAITGAAAASEIPDVLKPKTDLSTLNAKPIVHEKKPPKVELSMGDYPEAAGMGSHIETCCSLIQPDWFGNNGNIERGTK